MAIDTVDIEDTREQETDENKTACRNKGSEDKVIRNPDPIVMMVRKNKSVN